METKSQPFVRVDDWFRPKEEAYVYEDNGDIKLNLEKCMPKSSPRLRQRDEQGCNDLETFKISRKAFKNSFPIIINYIDYFIEFYDKEKELPSLYLHWKKVIDSGKLTLSPDEFRDMVFKNIFVESHIKENIYRMVEDNQYLDITIDKKSGRRFEAKEDFTNDDVKRLLSISMLMKILVPPVDHYSSISGIMEDTNTSLAQLTTRMFVDLFYKMGDLHGDDGADQLMEKIYIFVEKRTLKHNKDNSPLWDHQSALRGVTENSHAETLIQKYILYDNFFKLRFTYTLVAFLKSVINMQLRCTIVKPKYGVTPIKIDTTKGPDGVSAGLHKAEQQMATTDESYPILAEKSLVDTLERLTMEVGGITEEEIQFYNRYLTHTNWFHSYLINNMFAKEFNGFQELKIAGDRQYTKLIIIGKRKLAQMGYTELPWLITSVLQGKMSNRMLRSTKTLNKIKVSETYQRLMDTTYRCLKGFKDDEPITIISRALTNVYLFNEYEYPELCGEPILFDEDVIGWELLRFIDSV